MKLTGFTAEASLSGKGQLHDFDKSFEYGPIANSDESVIAAQVPECSPCSPFCVSVDGGVTWTHTCQTQVCESLGELGRRCTCVDYEQSCQRPRISDCDDCQQTNDGRWFRTCHPVNSSSALIYGDFDVPCQCGVCVADPPGTNRFRRMCYSGITGWRSQPCDPPATGCTPCIPDPDNPGGPEQQICFEPGAGVYSLPCCFDAVRKFYAPCFTAGPGSTQ